MLKQIPMNRIPTLQVMCAGHIPPSQTLGQDIKYVYTWDTIDDDDW